MAHSLRVRVGNGLFLGALGRSGFAGCCLQLLRCAAVPLPAVLAFLCVPALCGGMWLKRVFLAQSTSLPWFMLSVHDIQTV